MKIDGDECNEWKLGKTRRILVNFNIVLMLIENNKK